MRRSDSGGVYLYGDPSLLDFNAALAGIGDGDASPSQMGLSTRAARPSRTADAAGVQLTFGVVVVVHVPGAGREALRPEAAPRPEPCERTDSCSLSAAWGAQCRAEKPRDNEPPCLTPSAKDYAWLCELI